MLSALLRTKGSIVKRIQRVSGPTLEPVSFELQKSAMKIGNVNTNSFVIQNKIATARETVEREINRCLVQQIYDLFVDDEAFVGAGRGAMLPLYGDYEKATLIEITLPLPPVQQVIGIWVSDGLGNEEQVDPTVYTVSKLREPCRIRLAPGQSWPDHDGFESFRVRFSAGYVAPFTLSPDVPDTILATNHGLQSGDSVRFSSVDGTLPNNIAPRADYTVTNLTPSSFQLLDAAGNQLSFDNNWAGDGMIGEIPAPLIEAMVLLSGLSQGGEFRPKITGGSKGAPVALPSDPYELLTRYIWIDSQSLG